ncbi:MAG: methyltransferase domain-containing protein [Cyclobacteriaceae bacterium]
MYTRAVDLKRLKFITDILKDSIPESGNILDIGCGNGNISIHLGSQGFNVLGVDISEKAINTANQNNSYSNVSFNAIGAEELVTSGTSYDAIICSEVLEHLSEPENLLITISLLLKHNGKLIITVPNGNGPREALMTKPMQWMRRKNNFFWKITKIVKRGLGYDGKTVQSDADDLEHIHFFTKKSLSKMAHQHKYKISKFENADFIEDLFPFSLITKRIGFLQRFDCLVADVLPHQLTGGFHTLWEKSETNQQ